MDVWRAGHQFQRVTHFAVGQQVEKTGDRSSLTGERLLQRVVKNMIAGIVGKIFEHDRVFRRQRVSLPRIQQSADC